MNAHRSQAGSRRLGWLPVASIIFALACFASAPAWSQTWTGGDGSNDWFDPLNWSPNTAPNSNAAVVDILNATENPVMLNSGAAVSTLTLGNLNSLDLNAAFAVAGGSISNAGAITESSTLELLNGLTLSGAGTLNLAGGQIGTNSIGYTLANQSAITGYGLIGSAAGPLYSDLNLNNSGTINANSSGNTLTIGGTGSSFTNSGTLEATGGGTLNLETPQPINNTGGLVTAGDGSTVNVSTSIQGGSLSTTGTGLLQSSGTAELDASTRGAITLLDGSTYTGGGTSNTQITGNLILGTTTGSTLALSGYMELLGNTSLTGTGAVTMTGGYIGTNSVGYTLTNGATIQGYGVLGSSAGPLYSDLNLDNTAIINANSSGNTLSIQGTGTSIINSGTFEATGGGTLNLATTAAIQNFGNITAGDGSTVDISTEIVGGTLATAGTGVMQTVVSATLDAQDLGAITLSDGSTYTAGNGTTTKITGTLNLGTSTGSTLALGGALELIGNTTLSGPAGAVVNMTGDGTNSTGGQIGTNSIGYTLTNNVTIQGSGTIGSNNITYEDLNLLNNGTINANTGGATLSIQGNGSSIVNTGLMEATNGGILNLATAAAINNNNGVTAGTISAAGGTVNISTTIEGGNLSTSGGGVMQTSASGAELDASSHGAITLADGSTYTSNTGTTRITGTLNLGTSTGSTLALGGALELIGDTSLDGPAGAVVNITGNGTNSTGGQIGTNSIGYTLTNNVTIQGSGTIGSNNITYEDLNLLNNGTINANTGGATLSIQGNGSSIVNDGTFEATNGGTLNLGTSSAINNSLGSIISNGSGSTVNLTNVTIEGGILTTSGGGFMQTIGLPRLDGSTEGAITLSNGSTLSSLIANGSETQILGTLNLGTGGGATLTLSNALELVGNTTLSGAGGVVNISGDAATSTGGQIGTNSVGYLLTNNVTIQGTGTIGSNYTVYQDLNLLNNGTIDANTSGQTLSIQGTGTVTNANLFEATNGGILNLSTSSPLLNSAGSITANGAGSTVNITNTTLRGGTLTTENGGSMNMVGTSKLDGSTLGAITLSDGSTLTSGPAAFTQVLGTLNLGTSTGGTLALSGDMQLVGGTTLSGPGSLTMSGAAQIGTNSIGYTLTNSAGTTIQGSGLIGSNVGSLYQDLYVNNSGTILANVAGQTLQIAGTGTLTNSGTLQANAGSTLLVTNTLTNYASNTLTGGTYNANGGTIQLSSIGNSGGEIQTDAANIILSGASASLVDSGNHNALSDLTTIAATGSLTVINGQQLTVTPATTLTNNGTLTVGGTGTPTGSALTVNGNYTQGGGTLVEEIAGTNPGQYGVTTITGSDNITNDGSTLDVDLINGFSLAANTDYALTFMYSGGANGEFTNVICPVNDTCNVVYNGPANGDVTLDIDGPVQTGNVIPEPGTFPLLLTGLAGIVAGIKARRARRAA